LRTSVRIALVIIMAFAIVYTLAGFLLAPYLLKRQIIDDLSRHTGGTVTLGQLSVNPFLLNTDLRQLRIATEDHHPIFTLESMRVRLDIASLWHRGWIIREMVFDTPYLRVDALPEGMGEGDSFPLISISRLQVMRGHLHWTDTSSGTADDAMVELTGLEFSLENLGGKPYKPGQFTLSAEVNRSGWLRSSGSLRLFPGMLDTTLELGGVNLADLDSVFAVGSGSGQHLKILSALLSGKFRVYYEHGQTTIRGGAQLDRFELVDRSSDAAIFSAANVQATELAIQSTPFRASVEGLQLNQPHMRLARDADGTLRTAHWLKPLFAQTNHLQPSIPRIEIQEGLLDLTDQSLTSTYQIKTDKIEGIITRQDGGTKLSIAGRVLGESTSVLNVNWLPTGSDGDGRLDIRIEDLDATVLSPYLEAVTSRGIASGQLDMHFDYQKIDQQFELKNEISALAFQLDEMPTSPVTPGLPPQLPLDLAVALVRDGSDRINFSIPVPAGRVEENMQLGYLLGEGLVNLVKNLTKAPFYTLGKLNGISPPFLERIVFKPGDAALPMAAESNLAILAAALVQRPGLGLTISGRFDTVVDRQALARKQVGLHVALASSAGPPGREAPGSTDFNDSKVISVLDEFAGKRLSTAELEALRANHPQRGTAFYEAVFEALVRNEAVSRTKLKALARYRARTIVDQLNAAGVDRQRLQIGTDIETAQAQARLVYVELELWGHSKVPE